MFHDAVAGHEHVCFLRPDARLPMIYIDDCLRAVVEVLSAPADRLSLRTYNIGAMSFTPEELFEAIRRRVPDLKVKYDPDDRQAIGT